MVDDHEKEMLERLGTKFCQMCEKVGVYTSPSGTVFCKDCGMSDLEQRIFEIFDSQRRTDK